ncbi:MAG TPA: antibiotic biosynthesis monooxygenase [Opitutaceae bacterium]|nr:antibiotic biosynthesis monooxygenase [Opitutaceae bacterium]
MTDFNETEQVYWIVSGTIHDGQEAAFRAISARLVESTRAEPGALNYEWSVAADGRTFHIFERYADSGAVVVHRERSGELVKQLYSIATRKSFVLYGNPSKEVAELVVSRDPLVMRPLGGFGRP